MKKNKGFSLLELLIVVAIILIIATISIPQFMSSVQVANETAAISELTRIHTAQALYRVSAGSFGNMDQLISSKSLDPRFAGTYSGYNFVISTSGSEYTAEATPSGSSQGRYAYYTLSSDPVIRYSTVASLAPEGQAGLPIR
jgi:prepilin-type N-terminal cleavage/methylation domain-containing protein